MELQGNQLEQLSEALRAAFTYDRMERLLRYRLNRRLEDITLADALEQVAFDVIERAEAEGWTASLLGAARESAPGNALLFAFSQQFDLASTKVPRQQLEQTIVETNSFLDVDTWRQKLGDLEPRVCRVEIAVQGGTSYGTAFLVAPDTILTNYHVAEPVILGEQGKKTARGKSAMHTDVVARFDYKRIGEAEVVNEGVEHRLAGDWLVDASPYSDADGPAAHAAVPAKDELDYALLRLETAAGHETVGGKSEPGAPKRGVIEIPEAPHEFAADQPLFILQHPDAKPLKLALDTKAVIKENGIDTRVRYKTNTEPGSSGSPCFSQNWELVALHHSGDPNYDYINPPQYNRGIPIAAIRTLLDERGKLGALGSGASAATDL